MCMRAIIYITRNDNQPCEYKTHFHYKNYENIPIQLIAEN